MQCATCRRFPDPNTGGLGWYAQTEAISFCPACKPPLCTCGYTSIPHVRMQSGCRYMGGYDWLTDVLGCNGPLDD